MVKIDFQKTPQSIVDYLKNKQLTLTYNHYELLKQAHDKAFTVAKVTRMDLLNDIHSSLIEAIKTGRNFEAWKKSIIPTLEKKGWWGTQEIANPKTGEIKKVIIGSRRLKNIYDTNMRTAYNDHREEEMMKLPLSVYWMYRCSFLENSRVAHKKAHGIILHRDHKWWRKNRPQNAWGCKCGWTAHSEKDLKNRGFEIFQGDPMDIATSPFDYDKTSFKNTISSLKKINLDNSLQYLPLLNSARNNELKNLDYDGLKNRFYQSIGVKEGETFIDKTNDPILISDDFFKTLERSKINRKDRNYYILELADTLQNPDEIYLEFEKLKNTSDKYFDKDSRVVKKYMRYYKTETGAKRALIVLVEYLKDKTAGVSAYVIDSAGTVENKRVEKLIYKKD